MGSLTIPRDGLVYIDAQVAIYTVDRHPTYGPVCMPLWSAVADGSVTVVSSELILLETLVAPIRAGDVTWRHDREGLWNRPNMLLLPIARDVLYGAARLRAAIPPLKAPDAVHAATAVLHGCALFVTNDSVFRRVPDLPVAILDDAIVMG